MKKRDVLTLRDLTRSDLDEVLSLAAALKQERGEGHRRPLLAGKKLALVFQKPSLRTRATFDIGMTELGGSTLFLGPDEVHLGARETPADCARVLCRLVDIIAVRTFAQNIVAEMAHFGSVPVINALSDLYHPCQVLADLLTLQERKGGVEGLRVVFVGDGNNVAHSWLLAAEKLPFRFTLACPEGFEPDKAIFDSVVSAGAEVAVTHDPAEAVSGADAIYTDVWASMGQESEAGARQDAFRRLPGQPGVGGPGEGRRGGDALPAGSPRGGDHRRGDRRPPFGGVRPGREPASRPEGADGLVPRLVSAGLTRFVRASAMTSVVSHKYGYEDARAFWSSARRDDL